LSNSINCQKKQVILILGMHRSGTSALAGALFHSGLYIGHQLLNSNEYNKFGYFEHRDVVTLNDFILSEKNSTWQKIDQFSFNSNSDIGYIDKAKQIISSLTFLYDTVLIKDPRISLLLPIWIRALKELSIEPKIIICFRQPKEVMGSLAKRNNFEAELSELLYCNYLLSALLYSQDCDVKFMHYETLLSDKYEALIDVLSDLEVFKYEMAAHKRVNNFLSSDFRHKVNNNVSIEYPDITLSLFSIRVYEGDQEN